MRIKGLWSIRIDGQPVGTYPNRLTIVSLGRMQEALAQGIITGGGEIYRLKCGEGRTPATCRDTDLESPRHSVSVSSREWTCSDSTQTGNATLVVIGDDFTPPNDVTIWELGAFDNYNLLLSRAVLPSGITLKAGAKVQLQWTVTLTQE